MLSLNLAKIRTAQERFEKTYAPEAVAAEGDSFSIAAPVELAFVWVMASYLRIIV